LIHLFSTKKSLDLNKNISFQNPKNPDLLTETPPEVSKKLISQNHSKTGGWQLDSEKHRFPHGASSDDHRSNVWSSS